MIGGCSQQRRNVNPFVLLHRGGWKLNAPLLFFSFLQWQQQEAAGRCGGKLLPVREGFPGKSAVRTTTQHHHHLKKKQEAVGMRLTSMRISRKGGKYTQYTMVLPGAAAIALRQTRERVARFCLLDSCGANGNMHGASCARLQPMEKCETLSCYWIKVVRLGWLQQPHRRRCC